MHPTLARTPGLWLALLSALTFGTSGSMARGLLDAGWSPVAAVTARGAVAAALLAVPAALTMRGRWHLLRTAWPQVLLFGALGVGITQLAYFQAIEQVPVAVALLLEYLGIVLVMLWLWIRRGQRPRALSIAGGVLSLVGLVGVLDLVTGASINPAGAAWGLLAAVGLAAYFIVSADDASGLPPVALAAGGLLTGATMLGLLGAVGVLDMSVSTADVALAGTSIPWWLALAILGLVSTAMAYSLGIAAARALGPKVASFVGLTEVLFAVAIAWLALSELPRPVQAVGGALILAGVVAVKLDERRSPEDAVATDAPVAPAA